MTAQTLLSRLDRVRQVGRGRWIASCPTRQDRHPSLSIRELDDGRVLIHDFAGDSAEEILCAVGLTFKDLFPDGQVVSTNTERAPFSHAQGLRCIAFEALLTAIAACNVANGVQLSSEDKNRLLLASSRINHALEVCGCR